MKTYNLIAVGIILLIAVSSGADSLWKPVSSSLFSDQKASKVGDVVTIIITESTTSTQAASTDYTKKLDHSNAAGVGSIFNNLPKVAVSSSQQGNASGSTSRTSNFVAKLTATITKVLPNGNFEIEGKRIIETNKEKQEMKLTVIRPQDIDTTNSILSTFIADAQITSTGKGPIGDRQKDGILAQLLKFIF